MPLSGIPGSLRPELRTNLPFNPWNKCCSPAFTWDTGAHSPPWFPRGSLLDSKVGQVLPGTQNEVQGAQPVAHWPVTLMQDEQCYPSSGGIHPAALRQPRACGYALTIAY